MVAVDLQPNDEPRAVDELKNLYAELKDRDDDDPVPLEAIFLDKEIALLRKEWVLPRIRISKTPTLPLRRTVAERVASATEQRPDADGPRYTS